MISINSNIKDVIRQTEAYRAEVPKAVARALLPAKWIERAREVALVTLRGLAEGEEQRFVPEFVKTITATVFQGAGLALQMSNPRPRLRQVLQEAQTARALVSPGEMALQSGLGLFVGAITDFEDLILEWVQTEKDLDERDAGKTDEEVAHLISYILLSPNLGDKGKEARDKLIPHIVPWLQQKQSAEVGMSPERINLWMMAVLKVWGGMVRSEIAWRLRQELRRSKA